MRSAAATSFRCIACPHRSGRGFDVCPSCGMQNSSVRAIGPANDADPDGDPCQSLADYEEASVKRLSVCEPWHSLLGPPGDSGLPVSDNDDGTSALVYGKKGTGKTSLLLRLAASVRGAVVWVPAEVGMGPAMIKSYAVRLGLELRDGFRIVEPGSLEEMAGDVAAKRRTLVVLDSVSAFDHPITAWKLFREASPGAAFFAVVHATKRGQMAGAEKLGHLCDTIVRINAKTVTIPQKNRFGPPCSAPNPDYSRVSRVKPTSGK